MRARLRRAHVLGALPFVAVVASVRTSMAQPATSPPPSPTAEVLAPSAPMAPTAPAPTIPQTASPLRIEGPAGSIRFGLLAQPQYEAVGAPNANALTQNIFLRRVRLLVGGTLLKYFEYFVDTDYPNLFKENGAAPAPGFQKNSPGLNIQDAFVTFKPVEDMLKVDAGFMLPPLAHNAVQGATTLYAWDYFQNTFRSSGSFGNASPDPVGRDAGVQARGLVLYDHVEYRVGLFQGDRNGPAAATARSPAKVAGRDFFRVAARVQINFLDAEPPGYFYSGTYLGTRRIASVGASYDFQDRYKYWAVDGFVDMPAGPGVVTAQVNVAQWDGGTFIPSLPKQTAVMAEAGYLFAAASLSPILRYEQLRFASPSATNVNEARYVAGLAYFPFGHNANVKAFYSRIHPDAPAPQHDYDRVNVQWQLYFY